MPVSPLKTASISWRDYPSCCYSQNSTRMLGWALRASSKLLFFSTKTSSSSAISARLATASVQRSKNFNIVAVEYSSWQRGESCRRGRRRVSWEIALVLVFFVLFKVGGVAGILCLPLLTWHCTQKPEGSAAVRMRIYQAESSSCWNVTGPQQPAPGSEWVALPALCWHAYTSALRDNNTGILENCTEHLILSARTHLLKLFIPKHVFDHIVVL